MEISLKLAGLYESYLKYRLFLLVILLLIFQFGCSAADAKRSAGEASGYVAAHLIFVSPYTAYPVIALGVPFWVYDKTGDIIYGSEKAKSAVRFKVKIIDSDKDPIDGAIIWLHGYPALVEKLQSGRKVAFTESRSRNFHSKDLRNSAQINLNTDNRIWGASGKDGRLDFTSYDFGKYGYMTPQNKWIWSDVPRTLDYLLTVEHERFELDSYIIPGISPQDRISITVQLREKPTPDMIRWESLRRKPVAPDH